MNSAGIYPRLSSPSHHHFHYTRIAATVLPHSPVGEALVRRPARDNRRHQASEQCRAVKEHVKGVGDQTQAVQRRRTVEESRVDEQTNTRSINPAGMRWQDSHIVLHRTCNQPVFCTYRTILYKSLRHTEVSFHNTGLISKMDHQHKSLVSVLTYIEIPGLNRSLSLTSASTEISPPFIRAVTGSTAALLAVNMYDVYARVMEPVSWNEPAMARMQCP